jgi:hypothetical protein
MFDGSGAQELVEEPDEACTLLVEAPRRRLRLAKLAALTAVVAAVCVCVLSAGHLRDALAPADPQALVEELEDGTAESGDESGEDTYKQCDESSGFVTMTSVDPLVATAAENAFRLLDVERQACPAAVGPIPYDLSRFTSGSDAAYYLHAKHKFDSHCNSETYKLHFHAGGVTEPSGGGGVLGAVGPPDTEVDLCSFVVQVNKNHHTNEWTLLDVKPSPCELHVSGNGFAEPQDITSQEVIEAAEFATSELHWQMSVGKCSDPGVLKFVKVKEAVTTVEMGLKQSMLLELETANASHVTAQVTVLEICKPSCIRELELPGALCDALVSAEERLLQAEPRALGHRPIDHTEVLAARRRWLFDDSRRLATGKAPLLPRHITTGVMPSSWDPRDSSCYQDITVYDQGFCGSCYAQGFAAMMGLRKCLSDRGEINLGARRLRRLGAREANGTWQRRLGDCADNPSWSDSYGDTCEWYGKNDPGCKTYSDYGQKTHCKKSCQLCPADLTSSNPWTGADYVFMPSARDLATCSKDNCDGGNIYGIWDEWMRSSSRDIWVMGESCMPYDLKCEDHGGVVNPIHTSSVCSEYTEYQLWQKPCHCIPHSERPTSNQCKAAPSSSCSFAVPTAAFVVSGVDQSLSRAEAVLNFQRHIIESGPVYVSFKVYDNFNGWDWSSYPVYTGGGATPSGGHVVLACGWGTQTNDYWLLRNSWGSDWADKGYCKYLRGSNLYGIEDYAAVVMPMAHFSDWSPPACELKSWSRSWSTKGGGTKLTKFKLTLKISCSKECDMKLFTSTKLTHRDQVYDGVSGHNHDMKGTDGTSSSPQVDLLDLGFGLQDGDMWLKITATDSSGNTATSTHFVPITKVSGATSIVA